MMSTAAVPSIYLPAEYHESKCPLVSASWDCDTICSIVAVSCEEYAKNAGLWEVGEFFQAPNREILPSSSHFSNHA